MSFLDKPSLHTVALSEILREIHGNSLKNPWFNIKLSMIFPSFAENGKALLRPWPSSVNCGSVWSWPSAKPALHAKMSTGLLGKPGKTPGTSRHFNALHQWHQSLGKKHGDGSYWFLLVPVRLNFAEQTQLQKNPPRTSICWLYKQGQPPINNGKQW